MIDPVTKKAGRAICGFWFLLGHSHVQNLCLIEHMEVVGCYSPCGKLSYSKRGRSAANRALHGFCMVRRQQFSVRLISEGTLSSVG